MAIGYTTKKHKPCKDWPTFLKGQRKINGQFVEILDKMLDGLNASGAKRKRFLAAATKQLKGVAGIDPPGCDGSTGSNK